ncbi:MAG: hypothetical protein PHR25_04405 [Clostridia bacterium]|nr:hypothetical protein [Clostridia bacterium]MDD4376005.1 hypothetical protein [Clostridia bacterium]
MELICVTGDEQIDKSKYIYNKALEVTNQAKRAIVFVPSQARMIAEEEYFNKTNKNYISNVEITSISRFITKELQKSGHTFNKEYLTEGAKRLYVKKIVSENKSDLEVFSKVADTPSFIDMLISYGEHIKKQEITLEDIKKVEGLETISKKKLEEIIKLNDKIMIKTKENHIDNLDLLQIFCEAISGEKIQLKNVEMFFHGYNNFSKKELNLIKTLLLHDVAVTVSLTIPSNINEELKDGIFEVSYKTYEAIKQIATDLKTSLKIITPNMEIDKEKELTSLTRQIFNEHNNDDIEYKAVDLKIYSNTEEEIINIAENILKEIRMR